MTLDDIDLKINRLVEVIDQTFKKSQTPKNVMRPRDRKWGSRKVYFNINLDEFDIETLDMNTLKRLFLEFHKLRDAEAGMLADEEIRRATTPSISEFLT